MQSKTILAIETSCDETSAAVLSFNAETGDYTTRAHVTLSQIETHIPYGGVYPNLARREHEQNITHVIAKALGEAGLLKEKTEDQKLPQEIILQLEQILSREKILCPILSDFLGKYETPLLDAIAVTVGPGLEPALWVGVNTARALCTVWGLPAIPVNHMEGHIYSFWAVEEKFKAPGISFPAVALLISGGHSEFIKVTAWNEYTYLGGTLDDAVGEAYDKCARVLGLEYPGGPKISKKADEYKIYLAENTEEKALPEAFALPRPMLHSQNLDLSFSGLKTAVLYLTQKIIKENGTLSPLDVLRISYSFESAVIDVLVAKTKIALKETGAQSIIVGGGVAANKNILHALQTLCQKFNATLHTPNAILSTDNALMIALVGIHKKPIEAPENLRADGNLSF